MRKISRANKKRAAFVLGLAAVCFGNQTLRNKNFKLEQINTLLTLENQFLQYVISGMTVSEETGENFLKEIQNRAQFVDIVSKL